MAKATKAKKPKGVGGPFLAAAVFCDSILEDTDKSISVVKIHDGFNVTLPHDAPDDVPSEKHPIGIVQRIFVSFRTGDAPGKHLFRMVVVSPSGKRNKPIESPIVLSNEPNGGHNNKIAATLGLQASGMYWFEIYLGNKLYTKMPLKVSIGRATAEGDPAKKKGVTKTITKSS